MTPVPPTLDETLAQTDWVRRLARSLVSEADADDLAQDAWEASLSVEQPSRGWFAGALRNLAAFRHRTTARRLRRDAATAVPETTSQAFERVAASRLEREQETTVNQLRATGAHVVRGPPSYFASAGASAYLDIKARGLL